MGIFANKVVVVTGGNSGIGKAIAEKFNFQQAKIVIFGRDQAKLDATKQLLTHAMTVTGDVSKISDLDKLFELTVEHFGKIDVLVANAGIAQRVPVEAVTEQQFDDMVAINYKGVYFTVQRALPYLNDKASVTLISSIACHSGWPELSVYSSTKAAVSQLARSFSTELIHRGIRVNAISPGYTATPMFTPERVEELSAHLPTKRFTQPEEIADATLFLASATNIVGVDLVVDGGMTTINNN